MKRINKSGERADPCAVQNGPQTSMSRRIKCIRVVKIYSDECTVARHCKFKKKLLFLNTVCNPV